MNGIQAPLHNILHELQRPLTGCCFDMHEFVEIHHEDHGNGESTVIKWCKQCGSVISSLELNHVLFAKGDLYIPEVTQLTANANSEDFIDE